MKPSTKIASVLAAAALVVLALAGCTTYDNPVNDRATAQNNVTLDNSLGIKAQTERLSREEDTTAIRYVYLINYGTIFGYYTIEGGVYGADTQLAPEQEVACPWNSADACNTVDSAKDGGTYGGNDSGVFFITTDGVLVETTLDYIQTDAPLTIDVPRLSQ